MGIRSPSVPATVTTPGHLCYPGAPQICDGTKQSFCNDPGWPSLAGTNEVDDDGDTLSECAGDCDDVHAVVYPGAPQNL